MNEPDAAAKRAWRDSPGSSANSAAIRTAVERRLAVQRRQVVSFWGSAAIILPSWVAALWWFPDLRPMAVVGLAIAAWLMAQMYRRGPRRLRAAVDMPCVAHQRHLLTRERDFYRSMRGWYLVPVIIAQVALVATLLLNPRFSGHARFTELLTLFIVTVATVLVVALRRAQRIVTEIDRVLSRLNAEAG
jgi:hypothetical protein